MTNGNEPAMPPAALKYYIISVHHTAINDSAFTLYKPKNRGYCWFKECAGEYTETELPNIADETHAFIST